MKITIKATPQEIAELLQAITSSQEQSDIKFLLDQNVITSNFAEEICQSIKKGRITPNEAREKMGLSSLEKELLNSHLVSKG